MLTQEQADRLGAHHAEYIRMRSRAERAVLRDRLAEQLNVTQRQVITFMCDYGRRLRAPSRKERRINTKARRALERFVRSKRAQKISATPTQIEALTLAHALDLTEQQVRDVVRHAQQSLRADLLNRGVRVPPDPSLPTPPSPTSSDEPIEAEPFPFTLSSDDALFASIEDFDLDALFGASA